jgi:dipeptidyl aminopeptidase/acylaminoacyl peptidase
MILSLSHRSLAAGVLCIVSVFTGRQTEGKEPLTVARALETTRIMGSIDLANPAGPGSVASISPNGERYVLRLVRGDAARNGVWMEILTGNMSSLQAAKPKLVARLFTSGLGGGIGSFGSELDVMDWLPLRWLNDSQVVFLWSDERSIRQATRVDLDSGKVDRLTSHPTPLGGFDLGPDGAVLYYAKAAAPEGSAQLIKSGFVVPDNVDAYSLFHQNLHITGFDVAWNTQWFIQDRGRTSPRAISIAGRDIDLMSWHQVHFAPDGKTALVTSAPQRYPDEWSAYTGGFETGIVGARRDVRSPAARVVQQLYVLDVASGASRPLWNTISSMSDVRWSPDGRSLLLAPTHLPPADNDPAGLAGRAAAIVDVATGRFQRLAVDLRGRNVTALRWVKANEIELESRKGEEVQLALFRKQGGQWRLQTSGVSRETSPAALRIEVRQDLNTPPSIYAVELANGKPTGREEMILDPNPGLLEQVALGKAEIIEGKLSGDDTWRGVLFYPVDYQSGRRYPLLIQSVYGSPARPEFTLYGIGSLGPTMIAPYPGQVMANRGVAVLHLNVHMGKKFGTPDEAETRKEGLAAAAEHLISQGLVDRTKVGIVGFSRNGWYAEYSLTHSGFPFAAAISADNWDPSYSATMLFSHFENAAAVNGAPPFGEGLHKWLEKAPGFNVDRIEAPLLKIEQSTGGLFGVLSHWELVSRMRYLKKPLEFYVMPDAREHGAHNTQNPGQIMAVQQRAVDWFDFWLNGYEDPDPRKAEQYENWRQFRARPGPQAKSR